MALASLEVLRYLRYRGPASRSELARSIGVSSAALTKITNELISAGHVSEAGGVVGAAAGRPPVNISLNADSQYVVGAHLGAGRVELILSNMLLQTRGRHSFTFDPASVSAEQLLERAGREISVLIEKSGIYRSRLKGIGVSVPGEVDPEGRKNIYSSFSGWREIPVADRLEKIVGLPVILEHNATAIALSEARFGAGRESETTLYVYMRAGIGAGLAHSVSVPSQFTRHHPVEMGHVVLSPVGPPCPCGGRGCLEAYFSEHALLSQLALQEVPEAGLIRTVMENPEIWEPLYERFVQAIASVVALISPDLIILGGHLGEAPNSLFDRLNEDLPRRVMPRFAPKLHIRRTSLGSDDSAKGAACVGLEKFVYGEAGR